MGIFDGLRRTAAKVDEAQLSARRTLLAAAIESAGKPAARQHVRPRSTGVRMIAQAATIDRLTGDWGANPVGVDSLIDRSQKIIVARSREQATNNDYMKAYIRTVRLNVIGPRGIAFYSQAETETGAADADARAAVDAAMEQWGRRENCDAAGRLSWMDMQRTVQDCVTRDGEAFVQLVTGADAPMGAALRLIDPQRCPVDYNVDKLRTGNFVRQGIEFTSAGRPVAYFFIDDNERRGVEGYVHHGANLRRVPAEFVLHVFITEYAGQKRGLPWAMSGLYRAKHMTAMEDAAVINARVGGSKMGFIEWAEGTGPEHDEDDGALEIDAEPGAFVTLPAGAKVHEFSPQYPNGEFAPFSKEMKRGFAAGGGVSYHTVTGDLENVNYSSIRHGTLEEREGFKEKQEIICEQFHVRVFEFVFPLLLLAGHVKSGRRTYTGANLRRLMPCHWQPRRWTWVDPKGDVDAAERWKNNLLTSPSQLIREQGRDPAQVFAEIGEDVKAMQDAGIPLELIAVSMGQKLAPAAPPQNSKESAKSE